MIPVLRTVFLRSGWAALSCLCISAYATDDWGSAAVLPTARPGQAYIRTTPAPTGATARVQLTGQVQLGQGRFVCAVRNGSNSTIKGVVRFLDARGTEIKAPAFGFNLTPGRTAWRMLPVGTTTRDEPTVDYVLVLLDRDGTKAHHGVLQCRSGALERTPGDDVGEGEVQVPRPSSLQPESGALPGFSVEGTPVISALNVTWRDEPISDWREVESPVSRMWRASLRAGTAQVAVAQLSFDLRDNGRGDYLATLAYSIPMRVHSVTSAPTLTVRIPWALAGDAIVARRIDNQYSFAAARDVDRAELAASGGPQVDEWGLVCANDWLFIDLDSTWAEIARAGDAADADVQLTLHSRAPAYSLRGGSAGTIQLFLHLPVGLR